MVSLVLGSLKNTNVNHIQRVASSIDWEFLFRGANVNKKVDILNECLKNISEFYSKQNNKMEL